MAGTAARESDHDDWNELNDDEDARELGDEENAGEEALGSEGGRDRPPTEMANFEEDGDSDTENEDGEHGGAIISLRLGGRRGEHGDADPSLGHGGKGGKHGGTDVTFGLGGRGVEHGEAGAPVFAPARGALTNDEGSTDVKLPGGRGGAYGRQCDVGLELGGGGDVHEPHVRAAHGGRDIHVELPSGHCGELEASLASTHGKSGYDLWAAAKRNVRGAHGRHDTHTIYELPSGHCDEPKASLKSTHGERGENLWSAAKRRAKQNQQEERALAESGTNLPEGGADVASGEQDVSLGDGGDGGGGGGDDGGLQCGACDMERSRDEFSASQLKKKAHERRCHTCIACTIDGALTAASEDEHGGPHAHQGEIDGGRGGFHHEPHARGGRQGQRGAGIPLGLGGKGGKGDKHGKPDLSLGLGGKGGKGGEHGEVDVSLGLAGRRPEVTRTARVPW